MPDLEEPCPPQVHHLAKLAKVPPDLLLGHEVPEELRWRQEQDGSRSPGALHVVELEAVAAGVVLAAAGEGEAHGRVPPLALGQEGLHGRVLVPEGHAHPAAPRLQVPVHVDHLAEGGELLVDLLGRHGHLVDEADGVEAEVVGQDVAYGWGELPVLHIFQSTVPQSVDYNL